MFKLYKILFFNNACAFGVKASSNETYSHPNVLVCTDIHNAVLAYKCNMPNSRYFFPQVVNAWYFLFFSKPLHDQYHSSAFCWYYLPLIWDFIMFIILYLVFHVQFVQTWLLYWEPSGWVLNYGNIHLSCGHIQHLSGL